jgi:hypothetical protein
MSSSKIIDLQRDFAAAVFLSEAQNPIPIHTGKEGRGGVKPERSGEE